MTAPAKTKWWDDIVSVDSIFSSGDANTYDHPRAWVLGAAALSGRVTEDLQKKRLKAPLVYSTEIARSVALASIDQLRKYNERKTMGGKQKNLSNLSAAKSP